MPIQLMQRRQTTYESDVFTDGPLSAGTHAYQDTVFS